MAGEVAGLDAGLYHFAPEVFGLEALAAGDHRPALADATADPDVAVSPLALVVTGLPWRTAWKYAERGWRHVYWDAGTMLANLLAVAEGHELPVRVRLGFVDAAVSRLLGVDGATEFPERYLQLLPVINGWPASGSLAPALDWFIEALRIRAPQA